MSASTRMHALTTEVLDVPDLSRSIRDSWDALSMANGRPYASPAWMLSWWRHARPRRSRLRVVVVSSGGEPLGVLPFAAEPIHRRLVRYRLLASTTAAHVEPVARIGYEHEVAEAAAGALATDELRPGFVSMDAISVASPWPSLFRQVWPGGAWLHRGPTMPAPRLSLVGRSYDEWFAGLSRRRRSEFRRRRRRLQERGAIVSLAADRAEAFEGLEAFAKLHYARWRARGGSHALDRPTEQMLRDVADELLPSGRFRLWSIRAEGRFICVAIFLAAGGELSYWLGGFDETWGSYGPALETVRAALEHAWEAGDRAVDFGPGGQRYKFTFAEEQDMVARVDVVPRSSAYLQARARLAPEHAWDEVMAARFEAFRRLPPAVQQRVKAIQGTLRRLR